MNTRTTLILLAALVIVGLLLLLTRQREGEESEVTADERKLLDVEPQDVTKLVVTSESGDKLVLEKIGGQWQMIQPVEAAAEMFRVDDLVRAVTELQSRGRLRLTGENRSSSGLDSPSYTIELTNGAGKTYTIAVGEKSSVGGSLYVSMGDKDEAILVSSGLYDELDKPASDFRKPQLVSIPSTEVKQIEIQQPDRKLVLHKHGEAWRIVEPEAMAAEKSEVDNLLFAATGMRAAEFVSEDPAELSRYGLSEPRMTVTLSTDAPATQPTTAPATQSAPTLIRFGRSDVLQESVFVNVSGSPTIAKVASSTLESFDKKPLDLRDRDVVKIDAQQVSRIEIAIEKPATTQPTTRPAEQRQVVLERRKKEVVLGPVALATAPATTQATTQASTQPATQPASEWQLVTPQTGDANDSTVSTLIGSFNPLEAEEYLESAPTTQPVASYTVRITTEAPGGAATATHEIQLVDPGAEESLNGQYNGLAFKVQRSLSAKLEADFAKSAEPEAPPPFPPGPLE